MIEFTAQIKRVVRKSTISNDTEFEAVLITEQPLTDLMKIGADQLVKVTISEEENGN